MKKIKIYKNLADMEGGRIEEMVKLTPQERIKNTVELIKRIYNVQLDTKIKKKINFHP
ncbi:MAG: hypothetical protein ABIQ02_09590 [Saprospiraceae bacterium]